MDPQESEADSTKHKLTVILSSTTPVFGCRINPITRLARNEALPEVPPYKLIFTWYREQFSSSFDQEKIHCCVHIDKLATIQCRDCVTLNLSIKGSYHCSPSCFLDAWKKHKVRHSFAAETFNDTSADNQQEVRNTKNYGPYGSWPESVEGPSPDESETVVEREGTTWIKVGSLNSYVPTEDDIGFSLRLECVAVACSMGTHLSPVDITLTDPVIYPRAHPPRCIINCIWKSWNSDFRVQSSSYMTFSVLSYNILSDLYVYRHRYKHCPQWALCWDYRRQNILNEIIEYDADILCLQEVQGDHFDNFLKPELAKCGYSVVYKKKTKELYTHNQYTIDGCATFYRRDRFKEIWKYELEFEKSALPIVEALEPELKNQGSFRLLKDNVALVVILERVKNEGSRDGNRPRICVANTHIHSSKKFPDVKLFQVVSLINELEKIAKSKFPLLICGDLNSLPLSDPHRFISKGRLESVPSKKTDPFGIFQHLRLHHTLLLTSAYASFGQSDGVEEQECSKMDSETKEPIFTNCTKRFTGTLDYIFYTADTLKLESVLELLDKEALGSALPSPQWSSDHIAIMASFTLEPSAYED